jgi:hypothetical protein
MKALSNNSNPEIEAKIKALLEELEIKQDAFRREAQNRIRHLETDLEDARHETNVARHGIQDEVDHGLRKLNDSAKAIVFPDEVDL